ncbi:hypothetical protein U3516DRAFT_560757 [Neocallimastix sp. 'constans']|jgi:hypothetical protein
MKIVISLLFFILSFIWNTSYTRAQDENLKNFRIVKDYLFTPDNYYDVIKYEFEITPSRNVGKFEYYIFSDKGVYTLVMDRAEFELWENKYFDEWLDDPSHDINKYTSYIDTDHNKFICQSFTASCISDISFPERELYFVNIKNPTFESNRYVFGDNFQKFKDDPAAARLIYDPVNPPTPATNENVSSILKTPTNTVANQSPNSNNSLGTDENGISDSVSNSKIDGKDNNNLWWWLIVGVIILLVLLAILVYGLINCNRKDKMCEINELSDEDSLGQNNVSGSETEVKAIAYNPHHSVKRVAFNYKTDDIKFERDNIVEITKRYNDGWASAINPKDGKECIVPLIILEGDLSEDLSNIPLEEKSSKNILATPESLFENKYISQKDYEEMKRNDEWIKKVKLMKQSKPESTHNMVIGDNDQFKYISHPMQETKVENGIDTNQSTMINNRKSMVATVVNSNTELLNADHILEVCEEEDYEYEPEEGIIIKEDSN